jgi:hypothetical protein
MNMDALFPYANVLAGVLVLIVGFLFHFLGQLISLFNWELAVRIGIAEKAILPEYRAYEEGLAVADVALGWIYGLAGLGLILGSAWSFKLAFFPGVVMIYHSISFWSWSRNQIRAGHIYRTESVRIGWALANLLTGLLTVLVAWNGC